MALRRELMNYIGTGAIGGIVGYYVGARGLLGIQSNEVVRTPPEDEEQAPEDQDTPEDSEDTEEIWDFENQDPDEGVPEGFEAPSPENLQQNGSYQSRNGFEEVTSERSYQNSQCYHAVESEGNNFIPIRPAEQPYDDPRTDDVSLAMSRPNVSNESSGNGAVALTLHETADENPPVRVVYKKGEIAYIDSESRKSLANIGYGKWVYVTVTDINPEENTYTINWSTENQSNTERNVPMANSMDEGYTNTIIAIDDEGYADTLTIG